MNLGSIGKTGLVAVVLATFGGSGCAAYADSVQGFLCDTSGGSVVFEPPTSKGKKWVIPSINRVASLVDLKGNGPVGITYEVNPPQPFQNINWYYLQYQNSLRGITVRYCVQRANGSDQQSFDVAGGVNDRGGSVGDGWSRVVQDTRTFPSLVTSGNAYLSKLSFIFKKTNQNVGVINLGRVDISPGNINTTMLITDTGNCDLKEKCTKEGD